MKELIKITQKDGNQAVSARDLHDFLEIGKDFSSWIKVQIDRCDLIENVDYQSFTQKGEREIGGTIRIEYALTLDAAKEISMMSQSEKGKQARRYFIECEKMLKQKFDIPKTYAEALQLAADKARTIEVQVRQIDVMRPKAEFFDQVTDSKDALDMALCAKTLNLGIGRNRLFEFLRSRAILDRNNIPFQRYIDCGYFRTIEQKYTKSDGSTCINIKTVVYQSGMDYIRKLLTKSK